MNSPTSFVVLRPRLKPALAAVRHRSQLPDELNDGWANRDENNRRQNKDHQWGNHLDRGFCCLFFGALPAFRAEGVGMHPEGLRNARTEAISLYQCTNKRTDIVNARAVDQIAQSLGTGFAGAHLEVDQMKF